MTGVKGRHVGLVLTLFVLLFISPVTGQKVPVKVGLVVSDTETAAGKKVMATLDIALSDFYAAHSWFKTRLQLHPRSSASDVVISAAAARIEAYSTRAIVDLIKNVQVAAIIGPETSMEAHFDISLCDKANVPLITYSATSPFMYSIGSNYLIQATQVDVAQVQPITSIIKAFRWRQVVPIYVDNEFGGGLIPALLDSLEQIGTRIPYRTAISSDANDDRIVAELNNLKSMATRVFIVHMDLDLGVKLFSAAKKLDMMSKDYVWIITNGIGNFFELLSETEIESMEGVVGVRTFFPFTKELDSFIVKLRKKVLQEKFTIFELWAYDAITALARAVEQVGSTRFTFVNPNSSSSSDLSSLGLSQAGKKLIQAIRGSRFLGLSGDFMLVDGQLQSSVIEIINVVGKGEKVTVGFWTQRNGFVKEVNSSDESSYSDSKERLGSIIWPGGENEPAKGWVIPTTGKKLRVLVPIKNGFEEFVSVKEVQGLGTQVRGYCVDIFDEVMKTLPYSVPYEYIPLAEGGATSSYDELISEVYYQRYDAVMGDVSILANRSLYVDLTFPYADGGVLMVVPIEDQSRRMAWVFFKPLSWDLWLVSLFSFVIFGAAIWLLERKNPELKQIDRSLFFSFATVVFAHGHSLTTNLARCLVIVWLLFVFILTQSYTANLASMLTVNQLKPKVTDINELIKTQAVVGYQKGSFVKEFLKNKGINNLKHYSSAEELDELLTKGSNQGGVAAAFDEIPYLKVFMATSNYCQKYMMVPPTYKTDGLGFAFPLGSPLVADVSRRVLQVREGPQMVAIENKWFGQKQTCPESSTASIISSSSLDLYTYRQLFIIMLAFTTVIIIIFLISSWICPMKVEVHNTPSSPTLQQLKAILELQEGHVKNALSVIQNLQQDTLN